MAKENIESIQPRGVSWAGFLDEDKGVIRSKAMFKMNTVEDIASTYLNLNGNMDETLRRINFDIDTDEDLYIKPEEVIKLVDWASKTPVSTTSIYKKYS